MPAGVFRRVLLLGGIAVKVPRLRQFTGGMRSNRWEREMWRTWKPYFGWNTLCPVLFADPAGVLLVMARAEQPISQAEVESLPDAYPGITAETKPQNYGRHAASSWPLTTGSGTHRMWLSAGTTTARSRPGTKRTSLARCKMSNLSIDKVLQQQEAASPLLLVVRSSSSSTAIS